MTIGNLELKDLIYWILSGGGAKAIAQWQGCVIRHVS
jgi:hypothetical protein